MEDILHLNQNLSFESLKKCIKTTSDIHNVPEEEVISLIGYYMKSKHRFPSLIDIIHKIDWYPIKIIGSGTEGSVYEVSDGSKNKSASTSKVLKVFFQPKDIKKEVELQKKSALLGFAPHVYDYGIFEDKSYIVMDRIQGLEITDVYPVTQKLFEEVFDMYVKLLDNHISQRDLKTCNVMVSNITKKPYLLDYGIAEETSEKNKTELLKVFKLFIRTYLSEKTAKEFACKSSKYTKDKNQNRRTTVMLNLFNAVVKILSENDFDNEEISNFISSINFILPKTDKAYKWALENDARLLEDSLNKFLSSETLLPLMKKFKLDYVSIGGKKYSKDDIVKRYGKK